MEVIFITEVYELRCFLRECIKTFISESAPGVNCCEMECGAVERVNVALDINMLSPSNLTDIYRKNIIYSHYAYMYIMSVI